MRRVVIVLLMLTIIGGFFQKTVYAAEPNCDGDDVGCRSRFYNDNNIFPYNPLDTLSTSCSDVTGATGDISSVKSLQKSDKLQTIFQALLNGGMNAVQAAAVMGNMYTESHNVKTGERFDSSVTEVGNGQAGYGLAQWSYDRRTNLEKYAKQQGTDVSDMNMQLRFLFKEYHGDYGRNFEASLKGTAFGIGTVVKDATKSWMMIYEGPALRPADDPAQLNSERIPAANTIYGFYSSLTPSADAADAVQPDCGSNEGTNSGDIVQTALSLAWPQAKNIQDGDNKVSQATPAYQRAKPKYDPQGAISDCGAFVSTVMRMSGVDKNFPQLGVHLMTPYVKGHPELYQIIENAKVSDLQSGDIIIQNNNDHIVISQGANKPNIDASNGFRVPSVRPDGSDVYMIAQGSFIARYIGGNNAEGN